MGKSIAIVGGGAKAAAIVARAAVLRELLPTAAVPKIYVFEKTAFGAGWRGDNGYSNGHNSLCTPAEKDVGFPYADGERTGRETGSISKALFARFSWAAYCVAKDRYAEWINRGRDHPSHREWADYLKWVAQQAGCKEIVATIGDGAITRKGRKWRVSYNQNGGSRCRIVDGVILTGAGAPRPIDPEGTIPEGRMLDAETFWANQDSFSPGKGQGIAVVGNGGGAGSILAWLAQNHAERGTKLINISSAGTMFPRGDGYSERRWFSDPGDWGKLSKDHRNEIINRTEAGVISMRNKVVIDRSVHIVFHRGIVKSASWVSGKPGANSGNGYLTIQVENDGKLEPFTEADYLINAGGFSSWSLLQMVDHPEAKALLNDSVRPKARRDEAELNVNESLCLPGLPNLHIPALAALAQGPGFGNLGCLGLMAARILKNYE
jgi:mycobactin lysine-N-oxygenase